MGLILAFMIISVFAYQHELLHGTICKYYDGDAEYKVMWYGAATYCYDSDSTSRLLSEHDRFDLINELIGYNLLALLFFAFVYPIYLKML